MRVIRAVMCLLLGGAAVGQSQVRNAELGYSLRPPDGFTAYPEGHVQKDIVDCWIEATPASANGAIVLCVQRLHGTIGREGMRQEDLAARNLQRVSFKWKGFDVDGVRGMAERDRIPVVGLVSQVPLRHEAIQLIVSAPQDQEARAHDLMASTLLTLEGESNWLSEAERSERLGRIAGLVIGVAVGLIGVGIWRKRRRARSA